MSNRPFYLRQSLLAALQNWRTSAWTYTAGMAVSQVLTAFTLIVAARFSSPTELGSVTSVLAVVFTATLVVSFGSNTLTIRELATMANANELLAQRAVARTALCLGAAAVWAGGVSIAMPHASSTLVWAGALTTVLSSSQLSVAAITAHQRFVHVGVAVALDKVVVLLITWVSLGVFHRSVDWLWIAMTAGGLVSTGICLWHWPLQAQRTLKSIVTRPRSQTWSNPWRGAGHLGLTAVATASQNLDILVVGLVAGLHSAGIYSGVNRWVMPLCMIVVLYCQGSFPRLAGASSHREASRLLIKAAWLLLPLTILCGLVIAFAAPVVHLLLGDSFEGSVPVLQIMVIGVLPMAVNRALTSLFQARHWEADSGVVWLVMAPVFLCSVAAGAHWWGPTGAGAGFVVGQVICALWLIALARKKFRELAHPHHGDAGAVVPQQRAPMASGVQSGGGHA